MKLREVAKAISKSKRPLLYIGGGVIHSGGSDELFEFARENRIPVVSTLMGLGAYPPDDSLFLGILVCMGHTLLNMAVTECDLLLALGVRFDDRVTGKLELFLQTRKSTY